MFGDGEGSREDEKEGTGVGGDEVRGLAKM